MRLVLIGLAAVMGASALTVQPASAQDPQPWGPRAWCTQPRLLSDDWSFPDCRYYTLQQCQATAFGENLSCIRNPFYAGDAAPRRKAKRRDR